MQKDTKNHEIAAASIFDGELEHELGSTPGISGEGGREQSKHEIICKPDGGAWGGRGDASRS